MIRGDSFINIYAQVKVCSSKNENVTSAPEFLLTSEWFKRDAAPKDRTIDLRANIAAMEGKSEPLYGRLISSKSVAGPDLELKGRGEGALFVVCPAGFSSFCNFFYPKQGGAPVPPTPPSEDEKEVCMEKIFRFRKLFVRSKQIWLSPTKIKIA